jgi:H+/Cl- antiporter ClcA
MGHLSLVNSAPLRLMKAQPQAHARLAPDGICQVMSAAVKSLAAGLTSGSGRSIGREAAVIQIGAAIASQLAIPRELPLWQQMTTTAAGAAAGLAAAFNTPLGAIIFAVELMMPEIGPRTLLPVTIAAGTATFITRLFYGLQPVFRVRNVPATRSTSRTFCRCCPSPCSEYSSAYCPGFSSGCSAGSSRNSHAYREAPMSGMLAAC